MTIEGEKFRPREEEPGKGKVPEETPERIDREEIEKWFDTTGAYKSSTDLRAIKNKIDSKIKKGSVDQVPGIWSKSIRDEITKRWNDPFWEVMDTKLDKLTNKWLELARKYKGEKNIPKDMKEAWERKNDELMMVINQHRKELKKEKAKSGKGDIEDIESI